MDSSTVIVIAVAAVLVAALVMILATGRRRAGDERAEAEPAPSPSTDLATVAPDEDELEAEARRRADEAKGLVRAGGGAVAAREPVDEEEIGLTRRQFFNRGILAGMAGALSGFGVAMLAFIWPTKSGGLGSVFSLNLDQVKADIAKQDYSYSAPAKTYIVEYPKEDIEKAKKVYDPAIVKGMEQGYVGLYQKCVHLGCRVPFCTSSKWFECPCHGSKYNRVGEKRGGPAPRGLDRWRIEVSGGSINVDTSLVYTGPKIGTNTTGQSPEGAPCV